MRRAVLLVLVLLVAGCGQPSEPTKQAQTLGSISSEGRLVADGVVSGRTTEPFVRVQSAALAEQARSLEEVAATPRLRSLAERISGQLEDLSDHADDRGLADRVAARLERASRTAEELAR
jgi:hypothetical protein